MELPNPTDRGIMCMAHVRIVNHPRQHDRLPPETWQVARVLRDSHVPSGWRVELFDKDTEFGLDSSHVESVAHLDEYWDDDIPF